MKRPGLSARSSSMKAALAAHKAAEEDDAPAPDNAGPEQPAKPEKGRAVGLTIRLDAATHERLMDLAHDLSKANRKRVSIHSILLEGLDLAFAKYQR